MFLAPFLVGKIGLLCQKLKKLKTHLFSKQILRRMPIKSCSFTAQYEVLQVEFWLSNKFLPLPAFLEAKFAFVSQWSENPKIKVVSEIGLFGEHCRDRSPLVSFKTCRVPRFRLRCKYLCSMFFTQRNFSLVSTKYTKIELQTPSFSKIIRRRKVTYLFFWNALSKNLVS